jgi:hypothetical protein
MTCSPYTLVEMTRQTYRAPLQYSSEARTVEEGKKTSGCYILDYVISITKVSSHGINVFLL